jgi:hypothetical protein
VKLSPNPTCRLTYNPSLAAIKLEVCIHLTNGEEVRLIDLPSGSSLSISDPVTSAYLNPNSVR